ncbi:MAG: hypothetical protein KGK01_00765 [Bradyrhizobium sp.]|nr:hypothetical protein [Bradyrhizobium sp.]
MAMLSVAPCATAADSLPIQPGFYVSIDTPCQKASNATITLYDGTSFGGAHVECRKTFTKKLTDGSYQLTRKCKDMQGNGGPWETFTEKDTVVSQTEVIVTTSSGNFHYRYCSQSDLPDPWNTNDLKSIGIKDPGH